MNLLNAKKIITRLLRPFRKQSFALNELDLKLMRHLGFSNGFFIEAGANDGISQSNTLLLEQKLNWTGLLIEAIPSLAGKCKINRPKCIVENCALVSSDYPHQHVEMRYCNLMSVVKGGMRNSAEEDYHIESGKKFLRDNEEVHVVDVPAMTLSGVLDKHQIKNVNFLSLDVEGYESEVLKGIDFSRHAPDFMLIEVRYRDDIERIINNRYQEIAVLNSNQSYSDILYGRKN